MLIGPEAPHEDRFVLGAAARGDEPGGEGGEQQQHDGAIHVRVLQTDGSERLNRRKYRRARGGQGPSSR